MTQVPGDIGEYWVRRGSDYNDSLEVDVDDTRLPKRRHVADRTCRPATPSTLVSSNSIQPKSYSTSTTGLWPLFPGPDCASQRAG